jgi:WD40 repeat protein
VKWLALLGLLDCLIVAPQSICAQESAKFEKIRDISPDQKFAVLISCSSEPEDPNHIDSSLISAVKLVSLRSKKIVMDLQNYDGSAAHVIWSPDSNWLAFSSSSGPRVTDTYVYHRSGDDFGEVKTENLQVDVKGDVRNQYVTPLRWVKPGVLLLEQYIIFRGGEGEDATYRFTASFDEKTGKFRIISKKKIPSKE